jgi:hypothetical protein
MVSPVVKEWNMLPTAVRRALLANATADGLLTLTLLTSPRLRPPYRVMT